MKKGRGEDRAGTAVAIRKRTWKTGRGETKTAWTVDVIDRRGNRERRQFATKREADAFRISLEGQVQNGTFRPDAAKATVRDAATLFLTHCEGRMERRERMTRHNLAVYRGHITNYICPQPPHSPPPGRTRAIAFTEGLGHLRLRNVTARSIGAFRDDLRAAGVSVPTVRKILGTLQLILGHAVGLDLIAVNVARGVKVIGRRDEGSRRIVPPSKESLRQLLAAADPDFRIRLIVASATGVRAGELHALRWKHVDLDRAELTVETRVDAYRDEDVTKTAAGMRTIPLGAAVVAALHEWRQRSAHPAADDLVFPNRCGDYEGHDNMVKRRFLPLFRKLTEWHAKDPASRPLPPARFNWHALRHFAVSCWIEAGLSPKTVQVFAGHASLQVTMDRYGHLFQSEDHRRAMNAMADEIIECSL